MSGPFVVLAAFLACGVEMVEALTIVLAAGTARGWRSALLGAAAATCCLVLAVALLGPALVRFPIDLLRLVVGALLLILGLQWLRKAILRAAGYVPLHDESATYRRETERAGAASGSARTVTDWYGFTLSFKGVFLEGLEVAFIVITFGATSGGIVWATVGAGIAFVIVGTAGSVLRRPLSAVPENTLKFAVGTLLTTFGVFWGAEGAGVVWPEGEAALVAILAAMVLASLGCVASLKRRRGAGLRAPGHETPALVRRSRG
jgi:uncharacterized membrane protein